MRLTCVLKNAVILGAVNLWTKLVVERLVAGIAEKTATWIPLKQYVCTVNVGTLRYWQGINYDKASIKEI